MTTTKRKQEIAKRREEGAAAHAAGKSIHSNPYRGKFNRDELHWRDGFSEAAFETQRAKEEEAANKLQRLQTFAQERVNDLCEGDEQYAMQAILDLVCHIVETTHDKS